ncbi:Trk system potassium uptake protein TrkA (K(+)-uptake protein TrkA) [Durusdinium trenchii]|uniref:Trk system potassium uptake protein TrkA (K(+)-uptake protein TrkA) n=1 Tax=Durusdinium trenchii TaxID=1381693 RepID=A0ABP0PEJ1_9DINO
MKIVVLGAGTVGGSIAELLCQRRHDVTVIDSDPARAKELDERLDARIVVGVASQSSVLFQAGVLDADLALAVTGNDEVNLVAASLCKAMGARRSLARIYAAVYRDLSTFDYQRHFNIDRPRVSRSMTAEPERPMPRVAIDGRVDAGQRAAGAHRRAEAGGHEVDFVVAGNGQGQVGVEYAGLNQHARLRGDADYDSGV